MKRCIAFSALGLAVLACQPEPVEPVAEFLRLPEQPYAYTPELPAHFATLEQVVDHYSTGVKNHPNLSPQLRGPNGQPITPTFTPAQKAALVAFLETLNEPGLALDDKFSDPFIR